MKKTPKNAVVVYQSKGGGIDLKGDFKKETIWATQAQIAEIFNLDRSVVTKHVRNILKDNELDEASVCANFAHTAEDGKTYQVQFYNLDVILAVGYRANSKQAIAFRKWATKTLREHITKGYTINKKRISQNLDQFLKAVNEVKILLPTDQSVDMRSVLSLVTTFAKTWLSLEAYDSAKLPKSGFSKEEVLFTAEELT